MHLTRKTSWVYRKGLVELEGPVACRWSEAI